MKTICNCGTVIINSRTGKYNPDGSRQPRTVCVECLPDKEKHKLLKRTIIICPDCGSKRDTQPAYESKRASSLCEHCNKRAHSLGWKPGQGISLSDWKRLSEEPRAFFELSDRLSRSKTVQGYIRVGVPINHPISNAGRAAEHRLVMSAILDRWLEAHEIVHHINGKRTDNRPENLQLLTHSEHAKGTVGFCSICAEFHARNHT